MMNTEIVEIPISGIRQVCSQQVNAIFKVSGWTLVIA
jgi:hypothetical protein